MFATLYKEYPVCEWTVWLKNISGENSEKVYVFTDIDTGDSLEAIGAEVMQIGLKVNISDSFGAKIIHYQAK